MARKQLRLIGTCLLMAAPVPIVAQEPLVSSPASSSPTEAGHSAASDSHSLPSNEIRERTRAVAKVYLATLEVMHDRYFHGQRAMVPARAMEDVFSEVERELNIRAHWIAVNTKAMSINHEPKTDFEKQASAAIAQGKSDLEATIDGTYHLAVPVPLTNSCINCHAGMFRDPPKKKSFAGLILSLPINNEKASVALPEASAP